MMDILVPGNSKALLISSEYWLWLWTAKDRFFFFGGGGGRVSQGVDALRNKGDIKQTLENIQHSPNKRRFVEFWFICFFFTGYEQVSFLFPVSWSVVEL